MWGLGAEAIESGSSAMKLKLKLSYLTLKGTYEGIGASYSPSTKGGWGEQLGEQPCVFIYCVGGCSSRCQVMAVEDGSDRRFRGAKGGGLMGLSLLISD